MRPDPQRPTPEQRFLAAYRAHFPDVSRYVRRRVYPGEEQEILAEVFLVVWRHVDDIPDDPLPWLFRIAYFEVANHRRSRIRLSELSERIGRADREIEGDLADTAAENDALLRAFQGLSVSDKEILRLVAWEGLSSAEGAKVLGCSVASFRVQLHRARKRLLRALEVPDTNTGDQGVDTDPATSAAVEQVLRINAPTALDALNPPIR